MPLTLQDFLAGSTQKAADDLVEAFLRLPEEKRDWKPADTSRSALDQIAECALLNGYTTELLATRQWSFNNFDEYLRIKAEVAALEWEKLHDLLKENTRRVVEAIRAFPGESWEEKIDIMGRPRTMSELAAYPYWNMTYHLGQINYIASLLGCLQ